MMKKFAQKVSQMAEAAEKEQQQYEQEGLRLAEASRNAELATVDEKGHQSSIVLRDIGVKPFVVFVIALFFLKSLAFCFLLLAVAFFFAWRNLKKKSQMLRYIPTVKIADLQPGLYQTAGTIDPTVQPIHSWFTNSACFAYRARVEKVFKTTDRDGESDTRTLDIWRSSEGIDEILLRDDSGSIPIVLDGGRVDFKQTLRKKLSSDYILIEEIIPFERTTEIVGPVTSNRGNVLKFQARYNSKDIVHLGSTKDDMNQLYKKPLLLCLVAAIACFTIGAGIVTKSIYDNANCSETSCSFTF